MFKRIVSGTMLALLLISMLPLVWTGVHDVAIIAIEVNPTTVNIGNIVFINVTVKNEGTYDEGFYVTTYYDENIISILEVISLGPESSYTLHVVWNTTGVSLGTYRIKAEASILEGEVDTTDNVMVDGEVQTIRCGPQTGSLYVWKFSSSSDLYDALKNGEVDLTSITLNQERMEEVFSDPNIQAAISPTSVIYEFDFNNNDTTSTYRDYMNPTAYKEFRQGIACLVDKDYIVDNIGGDYSNRIDTPILRPLSDWWVNWNVSQYDPYGDLLGNYPYEYDPESAAYYFDLSGFVEGENTINLYYNESFPGSTHYLRINPMTEEDMDPLIFYIRNDDAKRLEAGRMLRDNLRMMGIPVNATEANFSTCKTKVFEERDYHIYTGSWSIGSRPYFLSQFSSENIGPSEGNYPQFRNATYDDLVEKVIFPSDLGLAREAAVKCQGILIEQAVCVWLWSPSQVMGYRNIYGVVNSRGGRVDNKWTFLKARLGGNVSRTAIYYGLYAPFFRLNVVTDYGSGLPQDNCLNLIYDTLLSYCPYDNTPGNVFGEGDRGGTMPWLAEEWELGRWQSPYNPAENLTKLTFYLRDGVKWHDGFELNSVDVKFTIEYIKNLGRNSSLYNLVSDVHHVVTPNARTVVVYENVSNIWTLDSIGTIPILPKHIFQNIVNVTGYTPGANEGHPANETLIGSGPWKYVFDNSSILQLEANRDYFIETPPKGEIDFRYDWEIGCWAVDVMDATMACEAYGASGNGVPSAKWEPGCDIRIGDCKVDDFDLTAVGEDFNVTWGRSARRGIVQPITECAIYVEPLENPIVVGENLTVYVKLKNLTKLSGVQFKLNYDNIKLDCLDLNVSEIFGVYTQETKKEINQAEGFLWVSISSRGSIQQVSGNTTLATITFNATKPSGSMLDLWDTKLAAYGAVELTCQLMAHMTNDREVMVGVSTPKGSNVPVVPAENAKITFANVSTEGVTTLKVTQPPSTEFPSVLCSNLETTATYTGSITLEFVYDPAGLSLEDEQSMKVWLWNETLRSWVDITSYVDTDKNIVYGVAPHLSMFGVTCDLSLSDESGEMGETTAATPSSPPSGLEALKLVVLKYYELQTAASYEPPITLRIAYGNAVVPPELESFIQIWLWEGPSEGWVDITWYVDTISNVVYGVAPHLSMFGVTSLSPSPEGIVVSNMSCSKTVVGQGYNVTINFTVENRGDFTKTFDVLVHCNSTALATYPVILSPGAKQTLSFNWSTTGWAMGNYAVSISSHLTGWIAVTIFGDVVEPLFEVDIYDITAICVCYNAEIGNPLYYPNCDVDGNGIIDIFDVTTACITYGQKYP